MVSEWCRYRPGSIHLGSRLLCNARHLAIGLGAISLSDKIAANDAGPYMQDFGYELRGIGEKAKFVEGTFYATDREGPGPLGQHRILLP
jgi:hypothetical protein